MQEQELFETTPNKNFAILVLERLRDCEGRIKQLEEQIESMPVETNWVSTWKAAKKLGQSDKTVKKDIDRDLELKPKNATYIEGYNVKTLPSGKRQVADFWLKGKVIPMENVGFLKVG